MYKEKLKKYREEANMTQKELAEKSGVSRSTINQLESGNLNIVNTETIKKLAKTLNCKVSDIFDGT